MSEKSYRKASYILLSILYIPNNVKEARFFLYTIDIDKYNINIF